MIILLYNPDPRKQWYKDKQHIQRLSFLNELISQTAAGGKNKIPTNRFKRIFGWAFVIATQPWLSLLCMVIAVFVFTQNAYFFMLWNSFVKHQHLHGNIYANDSKSTRCLSKTELCPAEGESKNKYQCTVCSVFLWKMSAIILKSHQLHGFVLFQCPLNLSLFRTSIKLEEKHNENLSDGLGRCKIAIIWYFLCI